MEPKSNQDLACLGFLIDRYAARLVQGEFRYSRLARSLCLPTSLQGAQAKMGKCFNGVYLLEDVCFVDTFGTIGKLYLCTFRIRNAFLNFMTLRWINRVISKGTPGPCTT